MTGMDVLDDLGRMLADLAKVMVERRGELGTADLTAVPATRRPGSKAAREGER